MIKLSLFSSIELKPITNIEQILKFYANTISSNTINFIKKNNLSKNETLIRDCLFFCKIVKSLYSNINEIKKYYKIQGDISTLRMVFSNQKSYAIKKDESQFTITIITSFRMEDQYYSTSFKFLKSVYDMAIRDLENLLMDIKSEFPVARYELLINNLKEICEFESY